MAVLSLVVTVWFAIGVRQAHEENVAAGIADNFRLLDPQQIAAAEAAADRAANLNPDQHIDVLRAEIALHRSDRASASRILDRVVAEEPQDIEAWSLLAAARRGIDPAGARLAQARVRALAPQVPQP